MGKDYLRIDDRLIHGQIVVAWCSHLRINEIIAIDDRLASNKSLQSIMLMGIPSRYKSHVVTTEDAKKLLSLESDSNRLFVTRFSQDLISLRQYLLRCEMVIIGNAAKRGDTNHNLTKGAGSVFFASDSDIALFDELCNEGVKLVYQTVPGSRAYPWQDISKQLHHDY